MRLDNAIARLLALALTGTLFLIGACSQPERLDTPETRNERLKVPPDLVSPERTEGMRIPALAGAGDSADSGDGNRAVLPEVIGVDVRRTGGIHWLNVEAEPRQVFRWAKNYVDRLGLETARRVPELGVIETEWLYYGAPVTRGVYAPVVQDADAAEVADRYIIRLERGETAGTTAVFVAHRRIQRTESGQWQRAAAEPFLEAEFLRGFMLYLGASEAESLQRVRATPDGASLVRLESGQTGLRLESGMEVGWRTVTQALDRAGFTVVNRDAGQRRFVVRYDPQASTRESDDDSQVARFRLDLQRAGNGVVLTAEPMDGTDAGGDRAVAERILALIREQIG